VIQFPAPNSITRPYRGLSMQEVDIPLSDESAILAYLLGREVYNSQDQLGGPQIMLPNGVAHMGVVDDQRGMEAI